MFWIPRRTTSDSTGNLGRSALAATVLVGLALVLSPSLEGGGQSAASMTLSERLSASAWQRRQTGTPATVETTWELFPNGTFRRSTTSDVPDRCEGRWRLAPGPDADSGVLFVVCLAGEGIPRFAAALPVELLPERLQLDHLGYRPVPPSGSRPPALEDQGSGGAVWEILSQTWRELTRRPWDLDVSASVGDPSTFSFGDDGTYSARFEETGCGYRGRWGLSLGDDEESGTISLWIPENRCDPRGPRASALLKRPVILRGDRLFVYRSEYTRHGR